MFTLKNLLAIDANPAPYETGDEFWNDPYISGQLLPFHLNPDTDLASYKTETMDAICAYLPKAMKLTARCGGDRSWLRTGAVLHKAIRRRLPNDRCRPLRKLACLR